MAVEQIAQTTTKLERCPVYVDNDNEFVPCNEELVVLYAKIIVGDDYGSWPIHDVYFACGHSFKEMIASLKNAEEM